RRVAVGLFVSTEEVGLVLDDRTAERCAVLFALVFALVGAGLPLGLGLLVEALVAEEPVGADRQIVRAGLGDDAQHAAGRTSVLGLVLHRLDLELLHRFEVEVL